MPLERAVTSFPLQVIRCVGREKRAIETLRPMRLRRMMLLRFSRMPGADQSGCSAGKRRRPGYPFEKLPGNVAAGRPEELLHAFDFDASQRVAITGKKGL